MTMRRLIFGFVAVPDRGTFKSSVPLAARCAPLSHGPEEAGIEDRESRDMRHRTACFSLMAMIALFVLFFSVAKGFAAEPTGQSDSAAGGNAVSDAGEAVAWGEMKDGIRMRVIPTLSTMSEDAIDPAQRVTKFETPDDVALIVELKNVTEKPIALAETRYGENYGTSKGKANSDWLGQFLFAIDYLDSNGKRVERPEVQIVGPISPVDGAQATVLQPHQTLRMLLRPAKWVSVFSQRPGVGRQQAVVRYRGVQPDVKESIRKFQKQSPLLNAIEGDLVAPVVEFEVARSGSNVRPVANVEANQLDLAADGANEKSAQPVADSSSLVWGPPTKGLRAAVEIMPIQGQSKLSHGMKPNIRLHVQNVGQEPVFLASHMWLSELPLTVTNENGEAVEVAGTWYSGITPVVRITLKPQQEVTFNAGNLGLALTKARAAKFEHITNRTMATPSGTYSIQATERFGLNFSMRDGMGKVLVPTEADWKGELKTGVVKFVVEQESIECKIVDAVTGLPVTGATATFRFIKPKSDTNVEETVALFVSAKGPSRFPLTIPAAVLQRADREELEIRWGVGQHADYELLSPADRISLKPFFTDGPVAARETLKAIKLQPKAKR